MFASDTSGNIHAVDMQNGTRLTVLVQLSYYCFWVSTTHPNKFKEVLKTDLKQYKFHPQEVFG